jgi:hypothetical protein
MEEVCRELPRRVSRFKPGQEDTALIMSTCLERWVRVYLNGTPWLKGMEENQSLAFLLREAAARKRITRSIYPLFSLRMFLSGDVAWIIVVLAYWGD